MQEKKTTDKTHSNGISTDSFSSLDKQIAEVRNSAIALYNVLEKKGIITEKEFMDEYNAVSSKKNH